jgi:hypothetical protein
MSETVPLRACVMGGPHDGRTLDVLATVALNGPPVPPNQIILAAEVRVSLDDPNPEDLFRRYAYDFVGFSSEGAVYHYVEQRRGAGPVRPDEDPT